MRATSLIRRRVVLAADAFVEVVVWHGGEPVLPSSHAFKYRLAYVVRGMCVLRYDNELGKGDHRHVAERQDPDEFTTPDQLMADSDATRLAVLIAAGRRRGQRWDAAYCRT